jgi:Peptidase A4 family
MANRPRRFLLYSFTALVPAIGLLAGTAVAASAGTVSARTAATHSAAAQAKAIAVAEIRKLTVGYSPTDRQVGVKSPGFKGLSDVTSTNWSGYADTGSSFSNVSAKWTEPGTTCSSRTTSLAAFWVGIDGYSSDSVEQDGTMIECYDRTAYQFTWWEMYPTNDVQVVGETAAAGDAITASVVRSGTSYKLTVTDATHTADSFSTTQTCSASSCVDSSAEWIAEAPTGSSGVEPLSDFGTWTASSAAVTEGSTAGSISSFTDDEITMIDSSGATKALPGARPLRPRHYPRPKCQAMTPGISFCLG